MHRGRLHQAVEQHSDVYPLLRSDSRSAALMPFAERPFGVNLIGHAFEVFGIGDLCR